MVATEICREVGAEIGREFGAEICREVGAGAPQLVPPKFLIGATISLRGEATKIFLIRFPTEHPEFQFFLEH